MGLNPVTASKKISNRFSSYITTTFRFNDENLNSQIETILREPGKFARGPIIEIIPPFATGSNMIELIEKGVLHPSFTQLKTDKLPLERPLFYHQEQAIKTICQGGQSAVVATGTGSGKTESFIIPILNQLFEEEEQGTLNAGVRALLLYPMNALANDQVKRLRTLLAKKKEITFGIYTGETEERYEDALAKYTRMFKEDPLPNELICRTMMRESPPHILLTNYAMLEYLMLRPQDNVFFQGPFASSWRYVVMDEAHTYTGAKGIEIAMLLARLKNAIGVSKGHLRFILTSASLGKGREDAGDVAKFASRLTGEEVTKSQIITAKHSGLDKIKVWGKPAPSLYIELQSLLETRSPSKEVVLNILKEKEVPKPQTQKFIEQMDKDIPRALYHLLQGDERVNHVIEFMQDGPVDLSRLAKILFGNASHAMESTASLLDLCNKARLRSEDKALLPARFHFFIKALEGAFITFKPKPKISLERINWGYEKDKRYKAFELGSCIRCHGLYLIGEMVTGEKDGYTYLEPVTNNYNMESNQNLEFFALADNTEPLLDNEDDILEGLGMELPAFENFRLCVYCGAVGFENIERFCNCLKPRILKLIKVNHKGREVHKCGLCGTVNSRVGVVRRFYLSEDAISSVLSTALYQEISEKEIKTQVISEDSIFGESAAALENPKSKQLLVFSDSRQNAAFFAPYLDHTYGELLARRLLIKTLSEYRNECLENRWSLTDFNKRVCRQINNYDILNESPETIERLAWKWIMREFAIGTGRLSLENMGLLTFVPDFTRLRRAELLWNFPDLQKVGIDSAEAQVLYSFLLDQFRYNRAVEYPEVVHPNDEYFAPQNQQGGFWEQKPKGLSAQPGSYNLKGWVPAGNASNTRSNYLEKILTAAGVKQAEEKAQELLGRLWQTLIDDASPLHDFIEMQKLANAGMIYMLKPSLYKVMPAQANHEVAYYICSSCHRITRFNLRNICPTYRCMGKLVPVNLEKKFKSNHYRELYLKMKPEMMVAHEHTAQLATEYAARVQTDFIQGKINVLSCSTTFELGVDVGELETVFMKNMPPTPANYAQRAGRAGRRIDSTAFALTFARLASHDFNHFSSPQRMISGVVNPPYFDINNEKIARRHLYACAFAQFWRLRREYFQKVDDFFCGDGPEAFKNYLATRPQVLLESLRRVLPERLHEQLGISDWKWVDDLYSKEGLMTKVVAEMRQDLNEIDEAIAQAAEKQNFKTASWLQGVRKTIVTRPLINFLAQKSLLPKYGFPVDVVNLDVNLHTAHGRNVDLSRDMQIAIAEYAPDSQVVASGKLWTSRYVKKIVRKDLVQYHYAQCNCGYFHKRFDAGESTVNMLCPICGAQLSYSSRFIVPEFGFIAERNPKEPGTKRPERTYACRKFFSGAGNLQEAKAIQLGKNKVLITTLTHGILTVINRGIGRGFYICRICGYGTCDGTPPQKHEDAYGRKCQGTFERVSLGYDLETDIAQINCFQALQGVGKPKGFWQSLLYSLIEGMCQTLDIERADLDGTIYVDQGGGTNLILFDTVPGGAGHVKRVMKPGVFERVLRTALSLLKQCSCGGEHRDTSCYGCLRNYQNQFVHHILRRDYAITALEKILE